MPEDKIRWKDRTAVVTIHLTPERRDAWKALAKAAGSDNLQDAFEEFLKSRVSSTGLSDLKRDFLALKDQQVKLGRAVGKERLFVLANAYKKLGGDVKNLSGYERVCGRMLKEWCPTQPEPSKAVAEVIQFEAFLEVNKRRSEIERELTGYPIDKSGNG